MFIKIESSAEEEKEKRVKSSLTKDYVSWYSKNEEKRKSDTGEKDALSYFFYGDLIYAYLPPL